ncbi:MAG TPA: lipocalin family protein [Mucilaginibacter sp.]|jgi:apolipoprotein D and lipocalin family protein
MKKEIIATTALAGLGLAAYAIATKNEPLETVGHVDLEKYLGKWYEIAAFPQGFEKGCTCTTAEYSLRDDGNIAVLNSCMINGTPKTAEGKATVTDKKTNAKLEVQFAWPFSGKYWIIALAPDYSYAVVGHPNRKYLWILGRKPTMDNMTYNHLVLIAAGKGFDIRKLVKTVQEVD